VLWLNRRCANGLNHYALHSGFLPQCSWIGPACGNSPQRHGWPGRPACWSADGILLMGSHSAGARLCSNHGEHRSHAASRNTRRHPSGI
jgi:hypothetical protein